MVLKNARKPLFLACLRAFCAQIFDFFGDVRQVIVFFSEIQHCVEKRKDFYKVCLRKIFCQQ